MRVLGGDVGTEHRRGHQPADGRHEDDPALGRTDPWEHRLGDGHLADDVHLELAAKVLERQPLDRPADGDPGVVDHCVQPVGQYAVECRDVLCRGDVQPRSDVLGRPRAVSSGSASESRRTPAITSQPAAASRRAAAWPIPRDAPVTSTDGTGDSLP